MYLILKVAITGTILNTSCLQKCPPDKPPLWYVFGGMGSQWPGMGRDMMLRCKPFKDSIQQLDQALDHLDFPVSRLLQEADPNMLESPRKSFIGIIAIQVIYVC